MGQVTSRELMTVGFVSFPRSSERLWQLTSGLLVWWTVWSSSNPKSCNPDFKPIWVFTSTHSKLHSSMAATSWTTFLRCISSLTTFTHPRLKRPCWSLTLNGLLIASTEIFSLMYSKQEASETIGLIAFPLCSNDLPRPWFSMASWGSPSHANEDYAKGIHCLLSCLIFVLMCFFICYTYLLTRPSYRRLV